MNAIDFQLHHHFRPGPPPIAYGGLAPWQVRRLSAHIADQIHRPLRIAELAQMVNLSPGYFSRAFVHCAGLPPHYAISCYRLLLAARMIEDTRQSLADIAAHCGLCDQAHLTRLFRRHLGTSPAQWRSVAGRSASLSDRLGNGFIEDFRITEIGAFMAAGRAVMAPGRQAIAE